MMHSSDLLSSELLSNFPLPFFYEDLDRVILECNQEFLEWVEKDRELVVGKTIQDILPEYISKHWIQFQKEEIQRKEIQSFDIEFKDEEGDIYFHSVRKKAVFDSDGSVIGLTGVINDLSQIKRAEAKLQHEHQMIRTVIDILPAFIYAKDSNSRFIIANKYLSNQMRESDPEKLVGKSDFDYYPHRLATQFYCDEQEVINTGISKLNLRERLLDDENGQEQWTNTTKVPLENTEGEIIGVVGTGFDITEQKVLDDRLRALQEIVNHSQSCAFLVSSVGNWKVSFCSDNVSLFGYEPESFAAANISFFDLIHPEDLERIRNETETSFSEGVEKLIQEYRIQKKDGGYIWVEDYKYLRERREDGSYLFQCLITDASRRHKIEDEKKLIEAQLRQAQKLESIGQLAAGIAHEINTPIQFINDNLQFLKESFEDLQKFLDSIDSITGEKDPEITSAIDASALESDLDYLKAEIPLAIKQSTEGAERVRDIVKAMKEFSHPGSGSTTKEDLNKAIKNTTVVARNEYKYVAELEENLEEDLPLVPVDIGQFKQSILNLIVNGAHAIEDRVKGNELSMGRIIVSSRKIPKAVQISVSDNGGGIPKKIADRIFDPFFTTKEVGKGTGQGLAIAYDFVVRKQKGKLYFDTEEGRGTTFYLEIPLPD